MSKIPLPWIKKVEAALKTSNQIPFWGFIPGFPFEALSTKLKELFQVPALDLSIQKMTLLKSDHFFEGFGEHPIVLSLALTPLATPSFWIMSQDNIAHLSKLLLSPEHLSRGFLDHTLKEGFYYFVCLKVLEMMEEIKAASGLTTQLLDVPNLPQENCHAIDVDIKIAEKTLWGRWLCPESLHLSIKEHFSVLNPGFIEKEARCLFELPLSVEVGYSRIPSADLNRLHPGDFLILDRCSFDPKHEKGAGQLTFNGIPFFQLRIKSNELKVIDYAYFEEIRAEESEGKEKEAESLWEGPVENSSSTEDLTTLVVELGQLKMPLEHVLKLKPEAILEISYSPEQPVNLSSKGVIIGQAELVKIGDVLGAKILHLE